MAPTRIEIDRILCPADFSEFSGLALERAVRLGNWFEARVEVLHVIPFVMPAGVGLPYCPDPLEVTRAQRGQAARDSPDLVAPFLGERVAIATKVLEGDPGRVIQEEAEALPADLLVIGTHGRSGFEHLLFGSVTENELRRAPCPVLTVGHGRPTRARARSSAGFSAPPISPSPPSTRSTLPLFLATENDAQLILLHVIDSPPATRGPTFPGGPRDRALAPRLRGPGPGPVAAGSARCRTEPLRRDRAR